MFLLMITALASDYPAFDSEHARELCTRRIEDPDWKKVHGTVEGCVLSERRDYRHFTLLAAQSDKLLVPAFRKCIAQWTKDGMIDWGMADYCATDVVNGKRDYDMYRAAARGTEARRAIRACLAEETDEDDKVIDWEMAGTCARDAFTD